MKQIRVYVDDKTYKELKEDCVMYRLTLAQLAGLKINGFTIKKEQTP